MSRTRKKKFATQTPDIVSIYPRNEAQKKLANSIRVNPITIGSGVAGTGKTLITLHEAVQMNHKRLIDKILYIKPNVQITYDKGVGFLPGTIDEKLDPMLAPIKDNLDVFCSKGKANMLIQNKVIEVQLMEYLRGRSLRDTFVILDEAQNMSKDGILTVLSRAEETTKVVLLGDSQQKDTFTKVNNGLADAIHRLEPLRHIVGVSRFSYNDIVRSSHLVDVIKAYDKV